MTTSRILLAALAAGATATAVTVGSIAASADGGASHASASIVDATGAEIGFANFTEDATGTLHVNVKVEGLTPGEHGIHIHTVGACSPTFAAASGHHNPLGAPHGTHSGDLPNLVVNVAGNGRLNATTDRATLSPGAVSVFDADRAALVIHALPDDFTTQPTGGSGDRIACGVIVAD
jgi:Cu-Zn family superoxide dismutase